jgi:Uma2 family endonuclease
MDKKILNLFLGYEGDSIKFFLEVMMIATQQKLYTFAEYLNYHDSSDIKYELFNGELISMPPASGFHALILRYMFKVLEKEIERLQLDWQVMPATVGIRTDKAKARIPDLMILTAEQCQEIRNMTTAVIEFPPLLVIEIISPGNADEDYRYKRSEYAVRGISEYWIVDPIELKISVLTLISGFYELAEFSNEDRIISGTFPDLNLTPKMVFE